ncbi:MAG TPA: TfoX/Sxy family protein [Terriglobia bacterium]|nr:TfoX/Sxy family protein [Terriglobia bacterium]
MAYDEKLAGRIRKALAGRRRLTERKMFGGMAFMLRGNMCCGVLDDELILRLTPEHAEKALKKPHTRPFDMTGRPMKGFVVVTPRGHKSPAALRKWVEQAARFARSLPAK